MTTLTGFSGPVRPSGPVRSSGAARSSSVVRPSGFDAVLIAIGRWLVSTGERLALAQSVAPRHADYEERFRDLAAIRHSGISF